MGQCEPVGQVIRSERRKQGLSQYTLADRLGAMAGNTAVTRHEVARWERGKRIPGPYWRAWLSTVLGISLTVMDMAARCARNVARPPSAPPENTGDTV